MSPAEVGALTSEEYARHVAMSEFIFNVLRSNINVFAAGQYIKEYRTNYMLDLDAILNPEIVKRRIQESAQNTKEALRQKHLDLINQDLNTGMLIMPNLVDEDE